MWSLGIGNSFECGSSGWSLADEAGAGHVLLAWRTAGAKGGILGNIRLGESFGLEIVCVKTSTEACMGIVAGREGSEHLR